MPSILRNPDPYPWGTPRMLGEEVKTRWYTLVVLQKTNEVVRLVESDVVPSDLHSKEFFKLDGKMKKKNSELWRKYSFPKYDVIFAIASNLKHLSSMFSCTDDFKSVKVERVSVGKS